MKRNLLLILCGCLAAASLSHALHLPAVYSDHMVLQRGHPVVVTGVGLPGERVVVSLSNGDGQHRAETVANAEGDFRAVLPPLEAGHGYQLEVASGTERVRLTDVAVGDVWICSGQSNMAWSLQQSHGAEAAIRDSANDGLRLFTVERARSAGPMERIPGGPWQVAGPGTVPGFSAVGYYFGHYVQTETGIPVGLIHSSWGGTQVESWTSQSSLLQLEDPERFLQRPVLEPERIPVTSNALEPRLNALLEPVNAARPESERIHVFKRSSNVPIHASNLYNAMIHPLLDFPIRGVIWYQGESNAGRAYEYRTLFPLMIEDWRRQWRVGGFPFYFVQLANYRAGGQQGEDSTWAELREAQAMALALPQTGMAVAIDIGESDDIHPGNKREVGRRLALQALQQTYGHDSLLASGPVLEEVVPEGSALRLRFSAVGEGLVLRDAEDSGFRLASGDGPFQAAQARVDGTTVLVESEAVSRPHYVRYGWADDPSATLFNKAGLPAAPFRTDRRPGLTMGNRYTPDARSPQPGDYFSQERKQAFVEKAEWIPAGSWRIAATGHDGNRPENLFDGDPDSRWSSSGMEERILVDLGERTRVEAIEMAFYMGDNRQTLYRIEASSDLQKWKEWKLGISSGTTSEPEPAAKPEARTRYLLFTFYGNTSNYWNSVSEIRIVPKQS